MQLRLRTLILTLCRLISGEKPFTGSDSIHCMYTPEGSCCVSWTTRARMADKYYRLVTFVVNICPRSLRQLFMSKAKADTKHHFTDLENYLLFRKPTIDNLRRRYKITDDQYYHIYPATRPVDIETWDVTLLTLLLKQLFQNDLKQNERDCLQNITDIRNSLQHIANTELVDDQTFNKAWSGLRDAVLNLTRQCADTASVNRIEEEIKSSLIENMPNLGHVLRTWHKVLYVQLELQNAELVNEVNTLKGESKKCNKILTKATVKRKGRSENLSRALKEENDCTDSFKDDISVIIRQLSDNHRVIVTGHDNRLTYKCALAAIHGMKFQRLDQCLEVNNPSDWKRVCPEDAQCVLFREPFGRATYDPNKVEVMLEEFDNMIDATNDENENVVDIIIVTNQRLLQEVTTVQDHEMLSAASTIYIDSTAGNAGDEKCYTEDTVHRNLLDISKMYKDSYSRKVVDKHTKEVAERLFLEHNAVTIVGPDASGKTSLSFQLLSSYDLSNGDENFFLIIDPGELKYVNFSLKPVIIIKLLPGLDFDKHEALKWYTHFDRLLAAIQQKKAAVISVVETEVFRMWQAHIPSHPVLKHIVHMPGTKEKEEEQIHGCATVAVQTDGARGGHGESISEYEPRIDRSWQIRSVKAISNHEIWKEKPCCKAVCVLPTGEVLVACNGESTAALIKMDCDYNVIKRLELSSLLDFGYPDMSYAGNNVVVITLCEKQLDFVDITLDMKRIKTLYTRHECYDVACHGSQMYVIDMRTVYLYTSDGEYQRVVFTSGDDDDDDDDDDDEHRGFISIAVSNDGGMIYIAVKNGILFTIDSSGNHLSTLPLSPMFTTTALCTDNLGYVYAICEDDKVEIVQVSSDGTQKLGTVYELDIDNVFLAKYTSIQFVRNRSALLLTGKTDQLTVLSLR